MEFLCNVIAFILLGALVLGVTVVVVVAWFIAAGGLAG